MSDIDRSLVIRRSCHLQPPSSGIAPCQAIHGSMASRQCQSGAELKARSIDVPGFSKSVQTRPRANIIVHEPGTCGRNPGWSCEPTGGEGLNLQELTVLDRPKADGPDTAQPKP